MKMSWLARTGAALALAVVLSSPSLALAAAYQFTVSDPTNQNAQFQSYSFVVAETDLTPAPGLGQVAFGVPLTGGGGSLGTGIIDFFSREGGFGGGFQVYIPFIADPVTDALGDYLLKDDPSGLASVADFKTSSDFFLINVETGDNIGLSIAPVAISAAPEPAAWALMISGAALVGLSLRRRRQGAHLLRLTCAQIA